MPKEFVIHVVATVVTNCQKCPNASLRNGWSSDGFDYMEDLYCKDSDGNKTERKVEGAVEWRDQVDIPEWCPLRRAKTEMVEEKLCLNQTE